MVLDGVVRPGRALDLRRSAQFPRAVDLSTPRPARPVVSEMQLIRRMDGVMTRRPVLVSPAPAPISMLEQVLPSLSEEVGSRQLPWRQIGIAFATVAIATLAASGVRWQLGQMASSSAQVKPAAVAQAALPAAPAVSGVAIQTEKLNGLLASWTAAHPGPFYVVVKDLKTGATAGINGGQQMTSASLYKLFVAQRILQKADTGELDLSRAAGGGTGRNIADCLAVMINVSDNGCGRALGALLGWRQQDAILAASGYSSTTLGNFYKPQLTSAADVATLLERLHNGTLMSPNSTARLLGHLRAQRVNNRLPAGLPAGTNFAHKTGDLDGVTHDAGIVYGPKTDYLVSVMSGPWRAPGNAAPQFADLSAQLWNFFQQ